MAGTRGRLAGPALPLTLLALASACHSAVAPPSTPAASTASSASAAADVPPVKVDQVGYLPGETKLGMVTSTAGDGTFVLRRASDDSVVLRGTLSAGTPDADSGDTIRRADFSSLAETGTFYLDVPGAGTSPHFVVADTAFASAFRLALRGYYGQRCGTAVDLGPDFPGYAHAACHVAGTPNPDAEFHSSSGQGGRREASQGWHDAGDYGKYVVNSGITTGELLWTYEWFAPRVDGVSLDIPESGDRTPDILDEVRWNLEWMLRMQDGDGGVWHKLTSAGFGSFVMPERDDGGPRYIVGTGTAPYKSSCATADFAAVMAAAGRIYRPFDGAFARRCLTAAAQAWDWVAANPSVVFRNCCGVTTGEYGDSRCDDEILWAAAELFRTTGEDRYGQYFLAHYASYAPTVSAQEYAQDWSNVKNLAMWAYYFSGQPAASDGARAVIRADTLAAADAIATRTLAGGYHVSLRSQDYVWGSNGGVANYGLWLVAASAMQRDPRYVQAALDDLHYLLGRNTHATCFVTRLGSRSPRHPHHRPSGALGLPEPWPGLLVGGPNRSTNDGSALDSLPAAPPARRWVDQQASYASNEIAINWNAPLVFLLASTLPPRD